MSDPIVEEDIDIYFTHGEPLFVTGLTSADVTTITDFTIRIARHHEGDDELIHIDRSKVNYWRVRRRTLPPVPTDAAGNPLEI